LKSRKSPRATAQSSHKSPLPLGAMMLSGFAAFNVSAQVQAPAKPQDEPPKQQVESITVTGANEKEKSLLPAQVTIGKVPALPKDIPQSLTVVTEKLISDQGQDTVKGALQNVPGITFEAGEGGRIGDNIRLRGFTVAGDLYLDGMRDIAQYNRDTFNVERIEVLRGSASMLFGRGSTGGVINQVSKTPTNVSRNEISTSVGSDRYLRFVGDFNVRLDHDNALRAAVMTTDGDGRAGEIHTQRRGAAIDARFGIGTSHELRGSIYHLNYNDRPDYGFRWLEGRPTPPPSNERWYGTETDYQNDQATIGTVTSLLRFAQGGTLTTTIRDGHFRRDLWATTGGLITGTTRNNFNDNSVVTRGNQTRAGEEHHQFLQSDYVGKSKWWGRTQEWLLGAELALERSTRYTYASTPAKPNTTFGNPNNAGVLDTRVKTWANHFEAQTVGVYTQATVEIIPNLKAIAGARLDRFRGDYERSVGGPLSRVDDLVSKRFGLMFAPNPAVNAYVAYGTSFNTSGDLYQYDPTSANTPPESARNIEAGVKWDALDGDLSLRTSIARTDKFNERSTDTETVPGGNAFLLSGQRHADTFEIEVAGRATQNIEVFAGFVYTRASIDKAGSSPNSQATVGLRPGLTPARQGNIWVTYKWNDAWRIGVGAVGVSQNKPALGETSPNKVSGYVKTDLMAEYVLNKKNTFRLNVENVGDKVYYSSLYRGFVVPGTARNARLTWVVTF
jgi:catecholate siderophore receptor